MLTKAQWQGLVIGLFIGGAGHALLSILGVQPEAAFFGVMLFAFLLALWNPPLRRFGSRTDEER